MKVTKTNTAISNYVKRPYARVLFPEDDGGYSAEILEFPGCYSYGATAEEAIQNLDEAAAGWVEAALEQGQVIPEPTAEHEPSGKYLLRLPRNLHKKVIQMAMRERVSVNTFMVDAIATRVGAEDFYARLLEKAKSNVIQNMNLTVQVILDRFSQSKSASNVNKQISVRTSPSGEPIMFLGTEQ